VLKFLGGMVTGFVLVAAALSLFGKPTEVSFESGDEKLLEKIDTALAIAIRGLNQTHTDHAALLQRDLAEAEILTRIEERLQTLGKRRILGAGALGAAPEELPAPQPEDVGRVERLERAALLTQSLLTGDHRTKKLLSHRDWSANWDELYGLLEPLLSASDREEIEREAAKKKAFERELQKLKSESESKSIIEDGAAFSPPVRSYVMVQSYVPTYVPSSAIHKAGMRSLPSRQPMPYPYPLFRLTR